MKIDANLFAANAVRPRTPRSIMANFSAPGAVSGNWRNGAGKEYSQFAP